ncbi:MAG TPA: response regulator transcription factor [Flavipsychrobacter sp.]|nr:response regulator transcription factor [Flavipsychrobacter sp.]
MKKIPVAIADDHALVVAGLAALIESFDNYTVVIRAINGKDLLDQIQNTGELPEICIIDIGMPVMNGYDTVAEIQKKWPTIRCMALSMLENEYCVLKMINNGACGYLLKGDNSTQLKKALDTIYENRAYHSDLLSNKLFQSIIQHRHQIPELTAREEQLLLHICTDLSYAEIGKEIKLSTRTVEVTRDSLFRKFHVNSRASLALFAVRLGIIQLH